MSIVHLDPCVICGYPIMKQPTMLWMPAGDCEEEAHESCAKFFLASRPPAAERRERWLELQGEKECEK